MLAWAAVSSSAIITCFGPSVWHLPTEALRVMLPTQALLIAAIFDLRARPSREVEDRGESPETTRPCRDQSARLY
jgi:hypothetical protein